MTTVLWSRGLCKVRCCKRRSRRAKGPRWPVDGKAKGCLLSDVVADFAAFPFRWVPVLYKAVTEQQQDQKRVVEFQDNDNNRPVGS